MKWETIARNIKRARENNQDISLPFNDFIHKIESAQLLMKFSDEQKAQLEISREAQKHLIVMSVSAMESYFLGTAQLFIDSGWYNDSFLEILKKEKVTLSAIIEINKEKVTLGEIIAASKSFQSLNEINLFFNKMFNIKDFIFAVSEIKVREAEKQPLILKDRYPDYRAIIDNLIQTRHKIIHQKYVWELMPLSKLMEMIEVLIYFVLSTEYYLMPKMKVGELKK
jgi:hypothetical protein